MNDAEILLAFRRTRGFSSGMISRFTGYWDHVDCVFDDGVLWGARFDHMGGKPSGVWGRPADYGKDQIEHNTVYALPCTILQRESYHAFYKSQEGKPYDWRAIVNNFGLGYDWRTPDHWFCSDIGTAAGESADVFGIPDASGMRKLFVSTYGTSPGMLAMLVSGRDGTRIVSSY